MRGSTLGAIPEHRSSLIGVKDSNSLLARVEELYSISKVNVILSGYHRQWLDGSTRPKRFVCLGFSRRDTGISRVVCLMREP